MDITKIRRGVRIGVASLAVVLASGVAFAQASQIRGRNDTTGYASDNRIEINKENNFELVRTNEAWAGNFLNAEADTGNNSADGGTEDGEIETGEVNGRIRVNNVLNAAMSDDNSGWSHGTPSVEGGNSTTGAQSNNEFDVNAEDNKTIDTLNVADAVNEATGHFSSGYNSSSNGTGHGGVMTGDVSVDARMTNDLNANASHSAHLYGEGNSDDGDIDVENHQTGYQSNNRVDVNVESNTEITETNIGTATNIVDFKLITGDNETNYNTEGGSIHTGDADFNIEVTNLIN